MRKLNFKGHQAGTIQVDWVRLTLDFRLESGLGAHMSIGSPEWWFFLVATIPCPYPTPLKWPTLTSLSPGSVSQQQIDCGIEARRYYPHASFTTTIHSRIRSRVDWDVSRI